MTTGLAYHPVFLEHQTGTHPERADRLSTIVSRLQSRSLWTRVARWEPRPANEATVRLLHSQQLIDQVRRLVERGGGYLDADTVVSRRSYEAALTAVGAAIEATRQTLQGKMANAIVLSRPPGHHATPDRAMGFCLFNNVALAAEQVLRDGLASKVFIVDLDVHHGNGTQDCFYSRDDVLYFSVHQSPFYPGTGHLSERGTGAGVGFTVNVPLPAGCGDETYELVARQLIRPLGERFRPDVVLVSLGFDAFWGDPLAAMLLSIAGYTQVLRQVKDLAQTVCDGRLVVVLEGGYNLQALASGIEAVVYLLLNEPVPEELALPARPHAEPAGAASIIEAVRQQEDLAPVRPRG